MHLDKSAYKPTVNNTIGKDECISLVKKYYGDNKKILEAVSQLSTEQFVRLFITAHGMQPVGIWQTHTYARYTDSLTGKKSFFLIPIENPKITMRPWIRFENNVFKIDDFETNIVPQSIPHTTPFWYFHYNPNEEKQPYRSMTLNLSPSCLERCVLCAGAKTGRVNNGMNSTLQAESTIERIFKQHPDAKDQLEKVAVVTGCFNDFNELSAHLADVRKSVEKFCSPSTYRVLEHNVTTEEQLERVVGQLGYDIFITLECFDQEIRNIALNGKVGRKGRDSQEFLHIIQNYANYLEARPKLNKHTVRVTYLMGLDSLATTEYFFQKLSEINISLKYTKVVPWLSIFTPYNDAMRAIQQKDFGLQFLLDSIELSKRYFGNNLLENDSGGTSDGYARGLF